MMTTVSFYIITAYTPTFGRVALHLAARENLIVTLCVGISNFVWLPIMGALSDRAGRRPLLLTCTLLALATANPALLWLGAQPSFTRLLTVEFVALFSVRQLQRSNGGLPDRVDAAGCPRFRIFTGLQPRNSPIRWLHAEHLHLFDSAHRKSRHARSLAVVRRSRQSRSRNPVVAIK